MSLVKEVFLKKNVGFGKAANIGAQYARGTVLLFLNPDTVLLSSDALDHLIDAVKKPKRGIVGAQLFDLRYRPELWSGGPEPSFFRLVRKTIGCIRKNVFDKKKGNSLSDWVSGAVFSVRRETFLHLGGFDERFFLYFEDVDLCRRIRKAGFTVMHNSEAKILHKGGASFLHKNGQKKYYRESQVLYFCKNRPRWERIAIEYGQKFFRQRRSRLRIDV